MGRFLPRVAPLRNTPGTETPSQVKAFRLLRSLDITPPSNTENMVSGLRNPEASHGVLDSSRSTKGECQHSGLDRNVRGNGADDPRGNVEEQETRRDDDGQHQHRSTVAETEGSVIPPPPESPVLSPSHAAATPISDAIDVLRRPITEEPLGLVVLRPGVLPSRAASLKDNRTSGCPGLYCNRSEARGGERSRPHPGPKEMPPVTENHPMFQLPLKVEGTGAN